MLLFWKFYYVHFFLLIFNWSNSTRHLFVNVSLWFEHLSNITSIHFMKLCIRVIHIMGIFVFQTNQRHFDNNYKLKKNCLQFSMAGALAGRQGTVGKPSDSLTFRFLIHLEEAVASFQYKLHRWKHLTLCQERDHPPANVHVLPPQCFGCPEFLLLACLICALIRFLSRHCRISTKPYRRILVLQRDTKIILMQGFLRN